MAPYQAWEITGAKKRMERERQIPEMWRLPESVKTSEPNVLDVPNKCGILTPEEISITSDYDALDIVQLTKTGKFSVEAITIAFCKRAAIAQQLVMYPDWRSYDGNILIIFSTGQLLDRDLLR